MVDQHFLLVTFPAQGHINPALQFAKRLIRTGAHVTFATSVSAHRRMTKTPIPTPDGLTYAPFSDGYDDGFKSTDDEQKFMSEFKRHCWQALTDMILSFTNGIRPVTCLIYNFLIPYAAEIARNLSIPSALLWIQPAAVLDIYYYYFNGYGDLIANNIIDPSFSIDLPGLPLLTRQDLPSFILPSDTHPHLIPLLKELIQNLKRESKPRVLVNTFDALESKTLRAVDKLNMVGIGPLIPSAFLDGKDPSDTSFGGDLFLGSSDYIEWLNTKPESSVVYVSFGTMATLSKQQIKEIASALLESRRPFLWVIRQTQPENGKEDVILDNMEELKQQGMIVPWCSQVEVLCHPSVGCFVTHCGWNSTLESLVAGVPTMSFPQWSDQGTNAKLIKDVWGTGVRMEVNEKEEGIVKGNELKRCLELVMKGDRGEEIRWNAKKWKDMAREAVMERGSSERNLRAFVHEIGSLENLTPKSENHRPK